VGVWVPGLPTTIFWIASAYLASKSCPVIQRWIYQRGNLGRSIELIVEHRSLCVGGKRRAIAGVLLGISLSLIVMFVLGSPPAWLVATLVACGAIAVASICFGLRTHVPELAA